MTSTCRYLLKAEENYTIWWCSFQANTGFDACFPHRVIQHTSFTDMVQCLGLSPCVCSKQELEAHTQFGFSLLNP